MSIENGTYIRSSGNIVYGIKVPHQKLSGFRIARRGEPRGNITEFTERSRRRMRQYLREAVPVYRIMATLTYPFSYPTNGAVVKAHLKAMCQRLRRYHVNIGRGGTWSCFWFLEFQERGAPHFHLLLTDFIDYKVVAKMWYEIVGSDDERHLHAGTRVELLRGTRDELACYANKYAEKGCQKQVPEAYCDVGRFWGVAGSRNTLSAATWVPDTLLQANSDVKDTYDRMLEILREALRKKKATKIKFADDIWIIKLTDERLVFSIRMLITSLANRVDYYQDLVEAGGGEFEY